MTAKEILSIPHSPKGIWPAVAVDATMHILELLPRLLDAPGRELTVTEGGEPLGIITQESLLEGLGRMIAPRDDCSIITVECAAQDYSASVLAHAVEDTDAHLVDLFSVPSENGRIRITLRIRHSDPTSAARSLERYDYQVIEARAGGDSLQELEIATERLLSLQALMNV